MARRLGIIALLLIAPAAWAADREAAPEVGKRVQRAPHEVPDDPYVAVPLAKRVTAPARRWQRDVHVAVQVNVDALGDNIVGDAANEPSIAVDPTDPDRMAIGWRQFDTITSNFRQAGWGYTSDGGATWTFPGVLEPGIFRSDPVLEADASGRFVYNSLSVDANYWCDVFRSDDGGATWGSRIYAYGGDKAWMAIDRTGGIGDGHIYQAWDYAGCCGDDWFNRSTTGGDTWEYPIQIPGWPVWGVTAVGPDGEMYIAGSSYGGLPIVVVKSTTMQDPGAPMAFDSYSEVDLGGSQQAFLGQGPNPGGLMGQVWVAVDHSDGPSRGNVYLLCSVDPPSGDPLEVMFARSTDGGATWSAPVRVSDDPVGNGAWQWFGTMAVAPNGRIDAIWNDTRGDPGGNDSVLYYAFSTDAGDTWSANEPLTPAFDPHLGWPQQDKLGDYYDMVSDNEGAHVAFAATFNGEQDVYYMRLISGLIFADDFESGGTSAWDYASP
jgi:hypothetical protein